VAHDAPTVLVAGLGDLGSRVLELLAGEPSVAELVGCGRASPRSLGSVHQAALVADALGGPSSVRHVAADLRDPSALAAALQDTTPDVVVLAGSRHSWWRTPPAASPAPYGVWLPLQLSLTRTFMRVLAEEGLASRVVALAYPDAAGTVLAAEGLAPHVGGGNVAEVAAKLRVVTAARTGVPRSDVDVRLVLHHAAERLAFSLFDPAATADSGPLPPYWARVKVAEEVLPAEDVDELLRSDYPLPTGTGSHQLTAATTVELVRGLLADVPRRLHAPAPGGLPGGYPVVVSRHGVELDLGDELTLDEAVRVNQLAARSDGIEEITPDGTILFTEEASTAARELLGVRLRSVALDDLDRCADALEAALERLGRGSAGR
jgi:hypothetical protein